MVQQDTLASISFDANRCFVGIAVFEISFEMESKAVNVDVNQYSCLPTEAL